MFYVLCFWIDASHACEKEEFSDWPNGLLAIGTFGNNTAKDSAEKPSNNLQETPSSSCEDQQDQELTVEEVGELSKELRLLVHKHSVNGSEKDKVALQKLFDCLQNMEEDEETAITELISESSGKEESTKQHGKEVQMEDKSSSHISKKSLSFLLKKAILCRGGFQFAPPPPPPPPLPLRERFPAETKFEKSRMEKILRAILHKKIYPQASNPRAATKKYLDNNLYLCENTDDESEDESVGKMASEGSSKWVKTDSDCKPSSRPYNFLSY
nr:protein LAZY 1-like [Ipomoea batatas]GMD64581.1 protein LAZY 1-like [Ipomoea batatas]